MRGLTKSGNETNEYISKKPSLGLPLAALVVTFAVFTLLGYFNRVSIKNAQKLRQQALRITKLEGAVLHFDEILTMSTQMASVTGNPYWEKRYNKFEPKLDSALKQLIAITPELFESTAARKTNSANTKLVAIERKVFEAVKNNNLDRARELLSGEAYQRQKEIYVAGMQKLESKLEAEADKLIEKQNNQFLIIILSLLVAVPLLIITWILTYQRFLRYIRRRRQTEEALQASEEKYKTLIESSHDSIFIITNGEIKYVNSELIRVSGYSAEQLIGKPFLDFVAPEERQKVKDFYLARLSGEIAPNKYESKVLLKSGKILAVEIGVIPIQYKGAQSHQIVCRDITEQKKMEKELRESEERFRSLYENSTIGLYRTNPEGEILLANPAMVRMMGFSSFKELQAVDLNTEGFAPGYSREEFMKMIDEKGEVRGLESGWRTKSGKTIYIRESAKAVRKNDGTIRYFEGTVEDISERKKAEEEIEKLSRFPSENPNPVLRIGINGVLQYANEAAKPILDKIKADNSKAITDKWQKRIVQIYSGNEIQEEEYLVNDRVYYINFSPIAHKGYVNLYARDITEQKEAEENLIKALEKAKESDRLKSAFLANMSHEIRTPMNGIMGFTNLLLEPDLTGEDRAKFIENIQRGGNRMLHTVNSIIEISRIEANEVAAINQHVNLNKLLEELCSFFWAEADKKNMVITCKKALPDEQSYIVTDGAKIESIVTNLLKNAIKYSEKGSIEIGYEQKNSFLQFYCKDEGIGIPANRKDAIFNRFEQADIEDKKAFQGTGLGLSISKSYVEMLRGEIWVESKEGQGSAFYFTLPYKTELKGRPASNKITNKNEENKTMLINTLLIVEDDQDSAELLQTILSNHVHEIIHVTTGMEAVETCRLRPAIDVILMDLKMYGMDGYEATRKIREFNKDVKIIAQTAYALIGDREKALEAGCDEYISKPIKREKLLSLIQDQ